MTPDRIARLSLALVLAGLVCASFPAPAARARQGGRAAAATPTVPPADDLASALERLRWDPSQGALLAVEPENVRRVAGRGREAGPNALRSVAARFDRRALQVGNVTVLVPQSMVVLNPEPGDPQPLAVMNPVDKLRVLLAALRPEQWEKIAGPGGLGLADLDEEQRGLFLLQLPERFVIEVGGKRASRRALTDAQRRAVRLRVNRATELLVPVAAEQDLVHGVRSRETLPWNQRTGVVPHDEQEAEEGAETDGPLRRTVPSKAKPGHLDYDAPNLSRTVRLQPGETLGQLVARVGRATGLELYADPRAGNRKLWLRDDSPPARAGDVLRALSLAVTGTFRRVGPGSDGTVAFVLTDDLVGIGTRYALLQDWLRDAEALHDVAEAEAETKILAARGDQYLSFAPDDPLALSPALLKQYLAWFRSPERRGEGMTISSTALPPSAVATLAEVAERERASSPQSVLRTNGLLTLSVSVGMSYVVPGVGVVPGVSVPTDETLNRALLQPKPEDAAAASARAAAVDTGTPTAGGPVGPLPARLKRRALLLAPAGPEEARRAAELARRYGFTELWLRATPDEAGVALLRAAVTKNAGGPTLHAVVPVFRAAEFGTADTVRDRNLLGESSTAYARRRAKSPTLASGYAPECLRELIQAGAGDWARCDAPETLAALRRGLARLAATPGVAGIALCDTAAPGYGTPGDDIWWSGLGNSGDFGYTPEMRLAFLRAEGFDPVDLSLSGRWQMGADVGLPFFPDKGARFYDRGAKPETPVERWRAFRHALNRRALADLRAGVRKVRPEMPVLVAERNTESGTQVEWFARWDGGGPLPGDDGAAAIPKPRVLCFTVTAESEESFLADYAVYFLDVALQGGGEIVIDLSRVTTERAAAFLRKGVAARNP